MNQEERGMAGRVSECDGGPSEAHAPPEAPEWLHTYDSAGAARIDVGPILAAGREPFEDIMALASPLAVGAGLIIEAPFDPVPLRRVLGEQGFETFAEQVAERHWRVWCLRLRQQIAPSPATPMQGGGKVWRGADGVHIDVRGLQPPAPLIAILRLIETDHHEGVIIAHLNRDPVHLYPELADRGWSAARLDGQPDQFIFRLHKVEG
jgi:Uncharacterized conserved protein (DUF2249)